MIQKGQKPCTAELPLNIASVLGRRPADAVGNISDVHSVVSLATTEQIVPEHPAPGVLVFIVFLWCAHLVPLSPLPGNLFFLSCLASSSTNLTYVSGAGSAKPSTQSMLGKVSHLFVFRVVLVTIYS